MKLIKSIIISFSLYSKIPMPFFVWESDDNEYVPATFPLVGMVIGIIMYLCSKLLSYTTISDLGAALLFSIIPIIITGGIHLDGFMDTSDALSSYASRDKKLEILKDPHIGAFCVIRLAILLILFVLSYLEMGRTELMICSCFVFVISRIFTSIAMLNMKNARGEGMLFSVVNKKALLKNKIIIAAELIIISAAGIYVGRIYYLSLLLCALVCYLYYRVKANKEFGGITGDTEGWFLEVCECACLITLVAIKEVMAWI